VIVAQTFWSRQPGFRMFTALWGSLAAVDLAKAAPPAVALALVALVALLSSVGQRIGPALAVGGICWLVATGFVVNDLGVLAVAGWPDAVRLVALLAVAVLGSVLGRRHRRAFPAPVRGSRTAKVLAGAGAEE